MSSSVDNIKIVPVNVTWKMPQTETFDFTGLVKTDLYGKAFKFYEALDAAGHYVWFDDADAAADPAIADFTAHAVDISATNTAAQIASLTAANITEITGFVATSSGNVMTVVRTEVGETTEALDVDSEVIIALSRRGRDYDLGLLQGDVQVDFAPSNFVVMSHQTGKTPLAALNQGFEKLEIATTLLETQASQLSELYTIYGGVVDGDTSSVFGIGSAAQGKNMMIEAGRLVLSPVNAEDDTENINLLLAIPVPDSLVFSGENPRTLKLTWQGFIDRDFNSSINALAVGDIFQDGLEET